jgi:hypothetical protein
MFSTYVSHLKQYKAVSIWPSVTHRNDTTNNKQNYTENVDFMVNVIYVLSKI